MKIPEPDEERPIAWNAVLSDTPVYTSDDQVVGSVQEVLGAEDIFHGIVVRSGPGGEERMISASNVARISNRRIDTTMRAEEIDALPPYREEETFRLGLVGLLRKHLGWVRDEDASGPR